MFWKHFNFTLQQVSLALAVIGLFITLTVKGREMMETAKVHSIADSFIHFQTKLYEHQERVHAQDSKARKPDFASTPNPPKPSVHADTAATFKLWQSIQPKSQSRKVSANRPLRYQLLDASGNATMGSESAPPISGLRGEFIICTDNIPGSLVKQLDLMMDDGDTADGAMKIALGNNSGEPVPTENISEGEFYLACLSE